jgi:hypothetical protein
MIYPYEKIIYSYERIIYSYEKVIYSYGKTIYSCEKVIYSYEKMIYSYEKIIFRHEKIPHKKGAVLHTELWGTHIALWGTHTALCGMHMALWDTHTVLWGTHTALWGMHTALWDTHTAYAEWGQTASPVETHGRASLRDGAAPQIRYPIISRTLKHTVNKVSALQALPNTVPQGRHFINRMLQRTVFSVRYIPQTDISLIVMRRTAVRLYGRCRIIGQCRMSLYTKAMPEVRHRRTL